MVYTSNRDGGGSVPSGHLAHPPPEYSKTVKKASTLTEEKLITAIGFPKNWKDISKYRV